MRDGRTLIQRIYDDHFEGAEQTEAMARTLEGLSLPEPDKTEALERMRLQIRDAREWRDVSNTFMAMPSARTRILGVQLYKYDIEGFLQWGYNFYGTQYSDFQVDPFAVTDGEAFTPAGDCFQVYPGEGGVPEESIRMMVASHAMQDLRAMRLLESLRGREAVLSLIDEGLAEPVSFTRYPKDAMYLLNLRRRINRAIVEARAN